MDDGSPLTSLLIGDQLGRLDFRFLTDCFRIHLGHRANFRASTQPFSSKPGSSDVSQINHILSIYLVFTVVNWVREKLSLQEYGKFGQLSTYHDLSPSLSFDY